MSSDQKIIKNKVGLLKLAEMLGSVSQACKVEPVGEHVSAEPLSLVLPDPNDLPFLEVAVSGGADA